MTFNSLMFPLMFPPTCTPPSSSFSGFRESSACYFLNGDHSHVPPTHNSCWCHGQSWPRKTHSQPLDPLCLANGSHLIQAKDGGFQSLLLCRVSWVYDFIDGVVSFCLGSKGHSINHIWLDTRFAILMQISNIQQRQTISVRVNNTKIFFTK